MSTATPITQPAATGQTWTHAASFWISGTPKPQNRPSPRVRLIAPISRFREVRTPRDVFALVRGTVYQDSDIPGKALYEWKQTIIREAGRHVPDLPLEGPIRVDVAVFLPRPQRLDAAKYSDGPIYHDKIGDRDNFDKTILDAMSEVHWWHNDGQVCDGPVQKFYHGIGGSPGVNITVWTLEPQPTLFGGEP